MDFWTWQSINSFLICSRSPTPLDRSFSSSDTRVSASKKLGKHVCFFESLVQLFKKEYKWRLITWIFCWSEQILWASLIQILMKCQILGSLTGQSGIPIQLLLLVLMHLLLQILIFHLHKRKLLLRVFQIRLGLKTELKTPMKNTQKHTSWRISFWILLKPFWTCQMVNLLQLKLKLNFVWNPWWVFEQNNNHPIAVGAAWLKVSYSEAVETIRMQRTSHQI